jgi:hypothetical protein
MIDMDYSIGEEFSLSEDIIDAELTKTDSELSNTESTDSESLIEAEDAE